MKNRYFWGIRARFLLVFSVSLVIGMLVALTANGYLRQNSTSYSREIKVFNSECSPIFEEIKKNIGNANKLQEIIDRYSFKMDIYVVDKQGQVLFKQKNSYEKQLDIAELLSNKTYEYKPSIKKGVVYDSIETKYYNIENLDEDTYIVAAEFLTMQDNMGTFLLGLVIFVIMFLILTYEKVRYIHKLSKGIIAISQGDFQYRVNIKGKDELAALGENINYMATQLHDLREKEKTAKKNKDKLIANVSHDLRTPLTSIIGYVKLLKQKYNAKDDIKSYIYIIDNKAQRLEELINDLFEYTKLQSQDIILHKVQFSLSEFMRQAIEGMISIASENKLKLLLELPEEEIKVNADPSKMLRVFENIIANAVRYSNKPGTIRVKVTENNEGVVTCIENEGKIIKEKDLNRIFDRLYRTDEARNSETGGSGLGLAIAKSIVELHEGRIWAQCSKNKVYFYVLIKQNNVKDDNIVT
ncbi:MAG: HAMP domain-containing sensor histidine kinase [Bacillota bacterium]|nr:HAMP domain-containing sensor histidine kinase [Bacillota bacterium]